MRYLLFILLLIPKSCFPQLVAPIGDDGDLIAPIGDRPVDDSLYGYIDDMAFWGGDFDFDNNTWQDTSGNDNDILLRNASARTGSGGNIDYLITGLLTTDVVTVESGSDTPTIPVNGTLRIGATDTIYGITIKRSGITWAVIPFCEPKIDINIPLISYDVSGNGNHATCAGLIDANIVTQDSYFYLAEYGYSAKGNDVLNWDLRTTNWTGSILTFDAKWNEIDFYFSQDADWNMQPTPDGNGARIHNTAITTMNFRDYNKLVVGRQYRVICETENYSGSVDYSSGIAITTLGLTRANENWIYGDGSHDVIGTANNVHYFVSASNNATTMDIDIKSMSCHEYKIVPALLDGSTDALGNEIEYEQTGARWLRWANDIALEKTNHNISVDLKGRWSDIMFTGKCVLDEVYLIEETELDYFGSGKVTNDTFQSDGTEILDRDNRVRQLLLNNGNTGFFFLDADSTQNEISYDSMYSIQHHFTYCNWGKTNSEWYKWTLDERNYIEDLIIIDSGIYVDDPLIFNAFFSPEERSDYGIITFVWDALGNDNVDTMLTIMQGHNIYSTLAIFRTDLYYDSIVKWVNEGQDCEIHTPGRFDTPHPYSGLYSHRGFHDDATNYTIPQLEKYYQNIFSPWITRYNTQFGNITHKMYPGGAYDAVTDSVILDYFDAGYKAGGSDLNNDLPLWDRKRLIRQSTDFFILANAKDDVDEAIEDKSWVIFYGHPATVVPNYDYGSLIELIEYVEGKINGGDLVRIMPMEEAWEVINRER